MVVYCVWCVVSDGARGQEVIKRDSFKVFLLKPMCVQPTTEVL